MIVDEIRSLCKAQPFRPFIIHLVDGRQVTVIGRDLIMALPSGRAIVVCQSDDTVNIIDILSVTDLQVKPKGGARRKR